MTNYVAQCMIADDKENIDIAVGKIIDKFLKISGKAEKIEKQFEMEWFYVQTINKEYYTTLAEYIGTERAAEYRAEHPDNIMFKEDGDKCVTIIIYHGYEWFKKGLENN